MIENGKKAKHIQYALPLFCSQEYTFTNTQKRPVFIVRKLQKIICKYIRKLLDIYEHL